MKSRLLGTLREACVAIGGVLLSLVFCLGYVGFIVLMWALMFVIFGFVSFDWLVYPLVWYLCQHGYPVSHFWYCGLYVAGGSPAH